MPTKPLQPLASKPWLENDNERLLKFQKGIPGKTADRWIEQPNIEPCWRGNYRNWRIHCGRSFQSQLFCRYWKLFINPSGFSCAICTAAKNDDIPPDGQYFPGQPPTK